MDFPNAQLPALTPIRYSFVRDEIERDIKQIFLDLFDAHLANDVFDINVLGMPHLGSLALVKRVVNADGLVLLPGAREEAATRYVYRAWKARNMQGRGLFFLKTYLQLLYPGFWSVEQQMQDKAFPYPTALYDRTTHGNDTDKYLTSRLHIKLDATGNIGDVTNIIPVIASILPARFVPKLSIVLYTQAKTCVAAVGHASIFLRGSGDVTAATIGFADSGGQVAARANIAITLQGTSTVSI